MTGQDRTWLRERAIDLSERVKQRGMTLSVDAAETLLVERHRIAAEQLGVTERTARGFLGADALDELADRLVADFTAEEPAADLFTLPRTAAMTVTSYGRLIAGLAEAIQFYETYPAIDDNDRAGRIHEIAQLLSVTGLLQSESDSSTIPVPPALFHRIARTLDTVASFTDNPSLVEALGDDSARARAAASAPLPPLRGVD